MQTVRSSGTPRLCHPFRVRALLGPYPVVSLRTGYSLAMPPASPAVPGGNRTVAVWVPEGNKEGSRALDVWVPEGNEEGSRGVALTRHPRSAGR
ncbi:MAG: hypothetical protein RLZZ253_3083, partial [Verrucomicrobiota bacterium]